MGRVNCSYCGKEYSKNNRHINENRKFGHNFYCSPLCQYTFKNKRVEFSCEKPGCNKKFKRTPKNISSHNYCSRSCAASINNIRYPKRMEKIRKCICCDSKLYNRGKYCSLICKSNVLTISKEKIIFRIKKFYKAHKSIPVKREMWGIYKPARKYFGTWNKAIEAAGFKPNPVMFANHQLAKDGHVCDSLAEKLIDDYLFENNIKHESNIFYPEGQYTFDFKIENFFIEYFGLTGEHKRYDELRSVKQKIVKKFNLELIEIYPKDLYPHSKLEEIIKLMKLYL